jgi:hypothetical protein
MEEESSKGSGYSRSQVEGSGDRLFNEHKK